MATSTRHDLPVANPQERKDQFEKQVVHLMDRLYGTALRLARSPDDAEDVVAETISNAWKKLDQLDDCAHMEGWLFRILHRTFISHWRRRRCRQDKEVELEPESGDDHFSLFEKLHQPFLLWWNAPEKAFINTLLQEDIRKAIDHLPDAYRVVIVLVEVEGYSYEEASHLLGLPLGTIRSRISRGRCRLQKALWQQAHDAGLANCGGQPPGTRGGNV